MAERDLMERLDAMIDAIVDGRPSPVVEPELAMVAAIAADLRGLPDPRLKPRLKRELFEEESMETAAIVHSVRPYAIVRGADRLIEFLQKTFDAKVRVRVPTPDGRVMHAEVTLPGGAIEMGDAGDEWEPIAAPMHVYVADVDETYRRAIAAGATSLYEPVDQPYGDREAGIVDPAGMQWFLATRGDGHPPATLMSGFRAEGAGRLIEFLQRVFAAEVLSRDESPDGAIVHAEVRIGGTVVEASEAHGQWGPTRGGFHVYAADCDALYAEALRAGATSLYEPADKPYGERSGGVTDPWGNQWYIGTPV